MRIAHDERFLKQTAVEELLGSVPGGVLGLEPQPFIKAPGATVVGAGIKADPLDPPLPGRFERRLHEPLPDPTTPVLLDDEHIFDVGVEPRPPYGKVVA